ncbi:hypothetical protein K439DRAFT_1643312 [Ramaria rubella]|nr:hypothetical protein K439DRAFT_1643312 [Ramaria rubella]
MFLIRRCRQLPSTRCHPIFIIIATYVRSIITHAHTPPHAQPHSMVSAPSAYATKRHTCTRPTVRRTFHHLP